jgi:hypothetical protein
MVCKVPFTGSRTRDFRVLVFLHESVSPGPLSFPLGPFRKKQKLKISCQTPFKAAISKWFVAPLGFIHMLLMESAAIPSSGLQYTLSSIPVPESWTVALQ